MRTEADLQTLYRTARPIDQRPSWDVFRADGFYVIRYHTVFDATDVEAYIKLRQSTRGGDDIHTFNDMRGFDFRGVDATMLRQIVATNCRYPGRDRTLRGYLVANDLGFGMMRMYQIMTSVSGAGAEDAMKVSRDVGDLLTWLAGTRRALVD